MKLQLSALLFIVAFTTACPNRPSNQFQSDGSLVSNVNKYLRHQQNRYNCALFENKDYVVSTEQCGTNTISGASIAQVVRNDAIEDAVAVIDSNYTDFISKLDTRRSTTDFLLDVVDLGTGAATGITKGERPNQILGIALTAFRGGRRSADLNFYKQQTTPILIAKMDDNRAKQYAAMLTKRAKPASEYSMKEAIRDIVNYYNGGTLIRAFAELAKDTSDQAKASEDMVRVLKGENITISNIPTVQHEQISDQVFAHRLSLARQLDAANRITVAADKTAKVNEVRLKYDAAWKDIEANEKFAPIINQMKADPDLTAIFAKLPANRANVTAEEFDQLINKFTAKVSRISKDTKNPELFEELLKILERVDK